MSRDRHLSRVRRWRLELDDILLNLKTEQGSDELADFLVRLGRQIDEALRTSSDGSRDESLKCGDTFRLGAADDEIDAKIKRVKDGVHKIKTLRKATKKLTNESEL